MKCSRCGCYQPNPSCYVCKEEETHPETPDRDGGSLLKTYDNPHPLLCGAGRGGRAVSLPRSTQPQRPLMKADTARFLASSVVVMCVATIVLLGATGYRDAEGYVAATFLAIFAGFVASTQDT